MGLGGTGFDDVNDSAYLSKRLIVGTTEIEAKQGASRLTERQELLIYNSGTKIVYFGPSGVTVSGDNQGIPLCPGDYQNIPAGENVGVFLISGSASGVVIVQEMS